VGLVRIVTSHQERTVLEIGDVFVKVQADSAAGERELAAMAAAPVPTPVVLWSEPGPPHVIALQRVIGARLGRLGDPVELPPAAWTAAGRALRVLHEAVVPAGLPEAKPWLSSAPIDEVERWLIGSGLVDRAVVEARAAFAREVLVGRTFDPAFVHGDLQAEHVHVDGGEVVGILDWSDACAGDALADLAVLTVGNRERLDDVLVGYERPVDRTVVAAHWTVRRLSAVRWMTEHGYDVAGDIAALAVD
jgi:aminoglycoside phosphotransferase (APT) family kinase protein